MTELSEYDISSAIDFIIYTADKLPFKKKNDKNSSI